MSRVTLRFSQDDLTERGSWFLLADGRTIRVKLAEAESATHTIEFELRFRKPRPGAIHVRPLDADLSTWLTESAVLHRDLARLELALTETPAYVGRAFLEL